MTRTTMRHFDTCMIVIALIWLGTQAVRADEFTPQQLEMFEKQIRPLLIEHCLKCHGPEKQEGGLNLATRESLVRGGDSGAAVVAGKPVESLLVEAVEYLSEPKMPPSGKLPADKIELLRRWVESVAAWPKDSPPSDGTTTTRGFEVSAKQKRWWAFQPVCDHAPPPVQAVNWPRNDLDRFILAKLEAAGIAPTPAADRIVQRLLDLAPRHKSVLNGAATNTAIRSPIAAARAGRREELPRILDRYAAAFSPLPNGMSLFEGPTAASVEHLGLLTTTLQDALLQSVSPRPGEPEVIRVFPAWPTNWNASFRLLARGGFLVSSKIETGAVHFVELESRLGEECRLRNPWDRSCIVQEVGGPSQVLENDLLCFPTERGAMYRISPARSLCLTFQPMDSESAHHVRGYQTRKHAPLMFLKTNRAVCWFGNTWHEFLGKCHRNEPTWTEDNPATSCRGWL
jgi:hypothetical protein